MSRLIVYNGTVQVGFGYVITDEKGKVHAPNIFSNVGTELPHAWYNLLMTGENDIVVLTGRIQ